MKTKCHLIFSVAADVDPRLMNMYEQVGQILSHYRSGKIPKAFKILPNLANWEQVERENDFSTSVEKENKIVLI